MLRFRHIGTMHIYELSLVAGIFLFHSQCRVGPSKGN